MTSNNPPDMTVTAAETTAAVDDFLKDHPVIETEDMAREAKLFMDRAKLCIADLEDERSKKVKPLNDEVAGINAYYRRPRELLDRVRAELTSRVAAFIKKEREKREKEAAEARKRAEEAARVAEAARVQELAAQDSAEHGELDLSVRDHIEATDNAVAEAQKAEREAQRAEKETKVKVSGGFTKAVSLRSREEITIKDASLALNSIGLTDQIREAILKSARNYRKLYGKWPEGITVRIEERL